jgi:nitroreductase
MNFYELVSKRFSCRKFKEVPVEKEKILKCIESARLAPSACNSQPWRFVVIDEPELKNRIAKVATSGIYGIINKFLPTAPCIILVLADREKFIAQAGAYVMKTDYYLIDIGIACEHLVLQATELGLGTCYIGYFNEKEIRKILNIPKKYKIVLLIAIGYPDEKEKEKKLKGSKQRRKVEEILYFNDFK